MDLQDLSKSLADAVESAGRSVVRVEGRSRPVSGTIISADGHVISISHAIERDEDLEVGLPDGSTIAGKVLGRDPGTDLALLRLEASGLVAAPWVEVEGARVGQILVGVYRPGRTTRATLGVIGALGKDWRTRFGGKIDHYLEASLPLHPGFSGGLLADASGRALALATSGLARGVALGIPAATVKRVAEALLSHGRVRRGYLGVGSYPVALAPPLQSGGKQATGLLILSVQGGSPAEKAGLLVGDTIVAVDGQATAEPADLLPALDEDRVGHEVLLSVVRGGELREVRARIAERTGA